MTANVAHSRLSEIFNEEAAAAVAAAAATAAAADDDKALSAPLRAPSIAPSLTYSESGDDDVDESQPSSESLSSLSESDEEQQIIASVANPRRRRASTRLIAQNAADIQRITGESTTQLISRCCGGGGGGGGCCLKVGQKAEEGVEYETVPLPDNDAFRSLKLGNIGGHIPTTLTSVADLPEQTAYLLPLSAKSEAAAGTTTLPSPPTSPVALSEAASEAAPKAAAQVDTPIVEDLKKLAIEPAGEATPAPEPELDTTIQPPRFVQPHPPYHVFPARIHNARELTRPGAEKRTYHFDLDVTDYPEETDTDFKVGGAIGVSAPNDETLVDNVLDLLMIPRFLRDKKVLLRTTKGRWPTVWGEDKARELVTTRRELLTWCSDIQSYQPTKALLRVLADSAADENERKLLLYLCSAEGQGAFCDFRTGPHVSLQQMLSAFPSAKPPLDLLLSILQPQMPRFYSLSNDPHASVASNGESTARRVIEIAVTVHETSDWLAGTRTGIGSGFFERQALRYIQARARGEEIDVYVPMFKGLMANPLAKQFVPDGPMLLIGAGVGIAPFRGFVQRRLKTANCANKVWVLQGIRDSLVDELYSGEWGVHEDEVKRVVESRRGTGRYVQEEVRQQADLVWFVINSVDGRVFVCGSTRGMGEGVQDALIDVAMDKGNLGREEARKFWKLKADVGQYIAETW